MRGYEERALGEAAEGDVLPFAVFVFSHAACEDVLEVRLDDRCILGWCPSCAAMRLFVSPVGRRGPGADGRV